MLKVVCFLWKHKEGFKLPSSVQYTYKHVNVLQEMVKQNLKIPHEFICITDMPEGIKCRTIPLWDKCRSLGGCYNRLYVFSKDMKDLIGERFVCMDIDCLVVGDLTPLFARKDPFVINSYNPLPQEKNPIDQFYNGGMFMMDAGARDSLWSSFDPKVTPLYLEKQKQKRNCIGTDQAWIRMHLGKGEARWSKEDGISEARYFTSLPRNQRIVFFAGNRDPSTTPWAASYWRMYENHVR